MQLRGLAMPFALVATLGGCDAEQSDPEPPPEVASNAVASELQDVVCDLALSCDCTYGRNFSSAAECGQWAQQQQAEVDRILQTYPLTWDPTCVGWYIKGFEDNGCGDQSVFDPDPDGDGCVSDCVPFHGDKLVGEPCTFFEGRYSNCGSGMYCNNGACAKLCPDPVGVGESCTESLCDDSTYCNVFDGGEPTCQLKAKKGDDCTTAVCADDLRCLVDDPTAMMPQQHCQPLAKASEPCMGHAECETGYCPAGFCEPIPQKGDSCRGTEICAEGLSCVEEVCGPAKKVGDSCETSCGGGLQCVDGKCLGANAAACYPQPPI